MADLEWNSQLLSTRQRDNDNCEFYLALKDGSKAAFCWQMKDELCGLYAAVLNVPWTFPPLSHVWHLSFGSRDGGRGGRW